MTCTELKKLLEHEQESLRAEIEKDKYYLSEKAGHDVGWAAAEKHFLNYHLNSWAEGYKMCYCDLVCQNKCELAPQR